MHNPQPDEDPAWLKQESRIQAPPPPPVAAKSADLPYLAIGWQDFERLCRRLAGTGRNVEATWAYGDPGQKQYGIDILVRLADGTYEVWQTKRYERVRPSDIRAAVAIFLDHPWAQKANRLVLAYACPLQSTGVVEAIEEAHRQLTARNVHLTAHDAASLTRALVAEPEIIDDFFGRPWVERTCSQEALKRLQNRLSTIDRNSLRVRLRGLYESWIATVDPGLPIAHLGRSGKAIPALPLRERFVEPDLLVRPRQAATGTTALSDAPDQADGGSRASDAAFGETATRRTASRGAHATIREHSVPLASLLASERQVVITGDAGAGKTTLLRAVALDMLADQPTLPILMERYHGWLPVWVPFALWTRMASGVPVPPSLSAVITAFFEARGDRALGELLSHALDSGRVLLLVDGLDEAVEGTAARTVATLLFAFAENRDVPVLLTSRPHGLAVFGGLPTSWMDVAIAPLNDRQRHQLAKVWFRVLEAYERDSAASETQLDAFAETRTRGFVDAIGRSPGLAALSSTPLFLLALLGLYRQGKALPTSRLAAIGEIIAQLVEHQPQRREVDALATAARHSPQQRQRDRLLDDFAFSLQSNAFSGTTPDAAPIDAAIAGGAALLRARQPNLDIDQAEATSSEVFVFAQERAGLLAQKSANEIGFLHLSFQEYLAARHVSHRTLTDRIDFVRHRAAQQRWREPILYLLYLTQSEAEVSELLAAIRTAPCDDESGRIGRDGLVTDAVFADLAHDVPSVLKMAEDLFSEIESTAADKRKQHLLSAVVDGLNSEAVAQRCRVKIAEWLPNRHGWHRRPALEAMARWPERRWPDCIPVLLRLLYADEDTTRHAAAETLARIAGCNDMLKQDVQTRVSTAASTTALASLLYALCCGWPHDERTGAIASDARSSASLDVAIEAIRIRAARNETDEADFKRFFGRMREGLLIGGIREIALARHFVRTGRDMFVRALEDAIGRPGHKRPHELKPLIGALLLCDPAHALVEAGLLTLFEHRWLLRDLFGPEGFDFGNMRWTPALVQAVEAHLVDENDHFMDYEFFWVSKSIRSETMKLRFLEHLRKNNRFKFWSARALVEVWGYEDSEVRAALLPFMEAEPQDIALVAHLLPPLVTDKDACRRAFVKALPGAPRVDMLLPALRQLGVDSQDGEAFSAGMAAEAAVTSSMYGDMWREQMILTFPERPEIRALAEKELLRHDGNVGAIGASYPTDDAMTSGLLRVLAPLEEDARLILLANLQLAATHNSDALDLVQQARNDTACSVSSEATIGSIEILTAQHAITAADVDYLTTELHAVGPDYEARRMSAVIGLAIAGRFDIAATATRADALGDYPMSRASLRGDDRYLRRLLQLWPDLVASLGSNEEVAKRFRLTAETVMGMLDPIYPNARLLYDLLMADIERAPHVNELDLLRTVARFEPGSEHVRRLVVRNLIPERIFNADAAVAAAEIVGDQFADDNPLHSSLLEHLGRDPGGAAGALAELVSRGSHATLAHALREKALGQTHDLHTHYRLMALFASPAELIDDLRKNIPTVDADELRYRPIVWPNALIRRVRDDQELQDLILQALETASTATDALTFAGLLRGGIGVDARLQVVAHRLIIRDKANATPAIGIDITNGSAVPIRRYMTDMLA